ncbi:MAG: hypothetical protein CMF48_05310 [Legionellales bacterium]|nr:hypothetical protein [Legionellales bacterium]
MERNLSHFLESSAHFFIDGPAGALELKTQSNSANPSVVGIICHPNPLQEGTMDNKGVHTTARAFETSGAASVRFNYRGVGKSAGEYGAIEGECDDMRAVVQWVKACAPDARLWFAGFSFGAYIAAKVAEQSQPEALLSIAPAVHLMDYRPLNPNCPWFVLRALEDEVVSAEEIYQWVQQSSAKIKCIDFPQSSHFFHGQLVKLRQTIETCFQTLDH